MCGSPLGIFGAQHQQTSTTRYSYLIPSQGYHTYGILTWMITDTSWCSRPLYTVWWHKGVGYDCPGPITWSYVQKWCFGGGIPTRSNLYIVHRYELPPWTVDWRIFHDLTCNHIPWSHVCPPGAHGIPWTEDFTRMRCPSWGGSNINWSSDFKNQELPQI